MTGTIEVTSREPALIDVVIGGAPVTVTAAGIIAAASDPGATGAGSGWLLIDGSGIPIQLFVRNVANDGWLAVPYISAAFPYELPMITLPFEGNDITYPWMVFAADLPAIAYGIEGDVFPRVCMLSDITDGWYFSDGTYDAYTEGPSISAYQKGVAIASTRDPGGGGAKARIGVGTDGAGWVTFGGILIQFQAKLIAGAGGAQLTVDPATWTTLVGKFIQSANITEPADGNLANSEYATWLDDTPGATVFNVKAKDSTGTVRRGSLALT